MRAPRKYGLPFKKMALITSYHGVVTRSEHRMARITSSVRRAASGVSSGRSGTATSSSADLTAPAAATASGWRAHTAPR